MAEKLTDEEVDRILEVSKFTNELFGGATPGTLFEVAPRLAAEVKELRARVRQAIEMLDDGDRRAARYALTDWDCVKYEEE